MKPGHILLACIITLMTIASPISAQQGETEPKQPDSNYKYWMNVGINVYDYILEKAGIVGSYNFSLSHNSYGQVLVSYQEKPFRHSFYTDYQVTLVALGVGKRIDKRFILIAGFIGPSYIAGRDYKKDTENHLSDYETFRTFGANINLQLLLKPLPEIGLGVDLIQNYNFQRSFTTYQYNFSIIINHW